MLKEFENKRYTALVKMREIYDVITDDRTKYLDEYFVYDTKNNIK